MILYKKYFLVLTGILLSSGILLTIILSYQNHILSYGNGIWYIASTITGYIAYTLFITITAIRVKQMEFYSTVLRIGIIAGLLWIINLSIETFGGLHGMTNILITAPFLLGGFVAWGVAGYKMYRRTSYTGTAYLGSILTAITGVLITLTYGFILCFTALPRLALNINGSPEYIESGWSNLQAFAVANTFDAARTHLLIAPILAFIISVIVITIQKTTLRLNEKQLEKSKR